MFNYIVGVFLRLWRKKSIVKVADNSENMYIAAPAGATSSNAVTLSWTANFEQSENITYQWYESSDGTIANGNVIANANTAVYNTPSFSEKGIYYYYCVAALADGTQTSDIFSVAYTGLPAVYLTTDSGADITSKEQYVSGRLKVVAEGIANYEDVDIAIQIKGRGNSSWLAPKKGYNLKLDTKTKILGMKKSKRWCVIANYYDKTLLRNKFVSYLGNEIFNTVWNSSFVSVDMIINGSYRGTYLLGENIKLESNRIDIQDISEIENDENGDNVTDLADGGFVLEVNCRLDEQFNFRTQKKVPFSLKDPDEVTEEVFSHIKTKIRNFENLLYSNSFADDVGGYRDFIDVDSVIDWYIVNELVKNSDSKFLTSVYMYFDPTDSKLHMGPNWDFDFSCGNENYDDCERYQGFWLNDCKWLVRMFADPVFVTALKERWNQKKGDIQTAINQYIQSEADALETSAQFNFKYWEMLGKFTVYSPSGYENRLTYQSEIDYMVNWLENRYNWLDSAINAL